MVLVLDDAACSPGVQRFRAFSLDGLVAGVDVRTAEHHV